MRIHIYIRNLLFILYAVYLAQGALYASGSIISLVSLLVILIICGIYFFKTILIKSKKELFYKTWTFLLLLNILGFVLTGDYTNTLHLDMFKSIAICMFSFYPFYYFAKKEQLKAVHLIGFLAIMLPITILQFYTNQSAILLSRVSDNSNVVNNVAYSFVQLLPFVFLIKNKRFLSIALLLIIIFFILQGSKRGAIIAGIVGLCFYFFYQIKTLEKEMRFKGYLVVFISFIIIGYIAYNTYLSNEFLIERLNAVAEGDSSDRDIIYKEIFFSWYNSDSFIHILFGFGFAGSLLLTDGYYAHNDWLELLSNFGLLGIVVYLVLFYAALSEFRKKAWHLDKRILTLTIVVIWFFTTLFSMWYTALGGFTQAILLAYLIGSKKRLIE